MRKNGFTLVEAIIAIAVGAIIMAAIYGYMSLVQKNSANTDRKVVTLQDTRAVLDLMAGEIRMASYDPQGRPRAVIWGNGITPPGIPACTQMAGWGGTAVPDNRGIQVANANTIFIAMDLDGDGTIGNAGASSEYIMYHYDGASTLYRNVSCGGNAAILGGSAPDSNVRNTVSGVTIVPLFQYYDGTSILPMTAPINIPAIRRILITIVADTANIDLNTKQPKRVVYSTSVMVRNHAY